MILNKLRILWTIFHFSISVSILIILMYIFKNKSKYLRQKWANVQILLLGINIEVEGKEDTSANMIAMNHQSLLDIVILEHLHSLNLAWVAKIEIANIPWFGHILKAPDMIVVERESKTSLMKLIKDTKEKFNQKRPIAIFPEGTRTNGLKLRKFKAGAKLIAQKHKFKVQPIVIVGTRSILDTHNFIQKSGTVKIIFLPTIQATKDIDWYKQMEEDMSNTLQLNLKSLNNDV